MRFYWITRHAAKRAGKKDGRKGYPGKDFDGVQGRYSDFEKRLSQVASGDVNAAVGSWRDKERKLLKEVRSLVREMDLSLRRFRETLSDHRQKLDARAMPEPPYRYGKGAIVLLFFLFLFEGAVNVYTFRFLREPGITTVVIGLALAFLIPLAGFNGGRILKAKGKTGPEWITAAALLLFAVMLIAVVAMGRRIAIERRALDPKVVNETFLIFLLMNVLFFAIAFWDGYASGSTYPRLQRAYEELRRRRRQFNDRLSDLERACNTAVRRARERLTTADELAICYREANRRARGNVPQAELPSYFLSNFRLPV